MGSAAALSELQLEYTGRSRDVDADEVGATVYLRPGTSAGNRGEEWAAIRERLQEISHLEDDWDGEGADAPTPKALVVAEWLMREMQREGVIPPTAVAPTAVGGILLEWRRADSYLEGEISGNAAVDWMMRNPDGSIDVW